MARRTSTQKSFLEFKLTSECNNSCVFCRPPKPARGNKSPDTDSAKHILEKNREEYSSVVFTGGEPTLRNDLFELMEFAGKECGYETVAIATNGRRMVYEDYAREAAAVADVFMVSLHGHKSALHDYLTGHEGSFAETCLGIKNLVSAGADAIVRTVVTESACPTLPGIAAVAMSLGVSDIVFEMPEAGGMSMEETSSIVPYMTMAARGISLAAGAAAGQSAVVHAPQFPHCILDIAAETKSGGKRGKLKIKLVSELAAGSEKPAGAAGPNCGDCSMKRYCVGPPSGYVILFTWKEFKGVQKYAAR